MIFEVNKFECLSTVFLHDCELLLSDSSTCNDSSSDLIASSRLFLMAVNSSCGSSGSYGELSSLVLPSLGSDALVRWVSLVWTV